LSLELEDVLDFSVEAEAGFEEESSFLPEPLEDRPPLG
jgi:hypothetical protein